MRKIVPPREAYVVTECRKCPYFKCGHDEPDGCWHEERECRIDRGKPIPTWCPLEDAPEQPEQKDETR